MSNLDDTVVGLRRRCERTRDLYDRTLHRITPNARQLLTTLNEDMHHLKQMPLIKCLLTTNACEQGAGSLNTLYDWIEWHGGGGVDSSALSVARGLGDHLGRIEHATTLTNIQDRMRAIEARAAMDEYRVIKGIGERFAQLDTHITSINGTVARKNACHRPRVLQKWSTLRALNACKLCPHTNDAKRAWRV